MKNTKEKLKAWRERLGIAQPIAAELLGVPVSTYRGWENGRNFPREKILELALDQIERNEREKV